MPIKILIAVLLSVLIVKASVLTGVTGKTEIKQAKEQSLGIAEKKQPQSTGFRQIRGQVTGTISVVRNNELNIYLNITGIAANRLLNME